MKAARDMNDAVFFADVTVISIVLHEVANSHEIFQISRLVSVLSQNGAL